MATTETFGWPRHAEDPDAYWEGLERMRQLEEEGVREGHFRQLATGHLTWLRSQGLLRDDRLSYTRICELEHDTGVWIGSWADFWIELRQAQQKDEERNP